MPRNCFLCSYPDQTAVGEAYAADATDTQIGKLFGCSDMASFRHRRNHILAPMRAAVAQLDRGQDQREQRAKQIAAIARADPVAITTALTLEARTKKLLEVEARLERTASSAEAQGALTAIAPLSAQQLKGVELGGRMGNLPGLVSPRIADIPQHGAPFSVNILFSGTGTTESITTTLSGTSRPIVDVEEQDKGDQATDDPDGPVDLNALLDESPHSRRR